MSYSPAKDTSVSSTLLPSEPLRLLRLLADPRLSEGSENIDVRRLPTLEAEPLRSVSEANEVRREPRLEAEPRRSESEANEVLRLPQLLLDPRLKSKARAPSMTWSEAEAYEVRLDP